MDDEVEPPPGLAECLEHGVEAGVVGDLARQHELAADRIG
jgi:hypothetical protein